VRQSGGKASHLWQISDRAVLDDTNVLIVIPPTPEKPRRRRGSTVYRTKQRFVLGNLAAALREEPRPGANRKLTGKRCWSRPPVPSHRRAAPVGRSNCWRVNWSGSPSTTASPRQPLHDSLSRETEAQRILRRLEFHYVPKHAGWLNTVEIEIGVLRSQCLDRRIATREQLVSEIAAWERQRNAWGARIKWMFTTEKARAKMGRAYPLAGAAKTHSVKES
jgi:DDE superfamily endonuclease